MEKFTFKASIDALEERVAILEAKINAILAPEGASLDQEEEEQEEE